MKSIFIAAILFAVTTAFQGGCGGVTPTPDPISPPTCTEVCAWWSLHGCMEAESTPGGVVCEEWCTVSADIPAFRARFDCILGSATCEQSRQCE